MSRQGATPRPTVLALQLVALGLPPPVEEFPFDPDRAPSGFRLDFAWPPFKVGLEYEGGITMGGIGHASTGKLLRDCRKASRLAELGWSYFRASAVSVDDGTVAQQVAGRLAGLLTPAQRATYEHWRGLYERSPRAMRPARRVA